MSKAMLVVDQKFVTWFLFDFACFSVYSVPVTTRRARKGVRDFGVNGGMIHTLPANITITF